MSPLLATAITVTLVLYAIAMALALLRLMRGPSAQDRVLALDFLSVVAMLMMLVLAIRYDSSMYFEGALAAGAVQLRQLGRDGQVPAARRGDRMSDSDRRAGLLRRSAGASC